MNWYIYLLLLSALYRTSTLNRTCYLFEKNLTLQVDKWLQFNSIYLNKSAHVIIYSLTRIFHQFVIKFLFSIKSHVLCKKTECLSRISHERESTLSNTRSPFLFMNNILVQRMSWHRLKWAYRPISRKIRPLSSITHRASLNCSHLAGMGQQPAVVH